MPFAKDLITHTCAYLQSWDFTDRIHLLERHFRRGAHRANHGPQEAKVSWVAHFGKITACPTRYRCQTCEQESRRPLIDVLGVEPGRISGSGPVSRRPRSVDTPATDAPAAVVLGVDGCFLGMQVRARRGRRQSPDELLPPLPPSRKVTFGRSKRASCCKQGARQDCEMILEAAFRCPLGATANGEAVARANETASSRASDWRCDNISIR